MHEETTMKKKFPFLAIGIALALTIFVAMISGCTNRQIIDTAHKFDYGIVRLANGDVVEGKVDSWLDFENSDTVQITIEGKTYLVHYTNATLIKD